MSALLGSGQRAVAEAYQRVLTIVMTIDKVKRAAVELAGALETNAVTPDVRKRFIALRTALFQGTGSSIRFWRDSTPRPCPRRPTREIAYQLLAIAENLR